MGTYSIVGAFYRKPAKALLNVLPVGVPLTLRAEPDNPADPNAIAVWLLTENIPEASLARLDGELIGYGKTLKDILDAECWQVGYIPRELAATLRANRFPTDVDVPGRFTCTASGAPQVRFDE